MRLHEFKSLICGNNHCFDISKKGYVNLTVKSVKSDYDKKMFESRSLISSSGFFQPLTEQISSLIVKEIHNPGSKDTKIKDIKILDAGCGEGSHLAEIINSLGANSPGANSFGADDVGHAQGVSKNKLEITGINKGQGAGLQNIQNIQAAGMDISKEGVQIASRKYPHIIWCAADITRIPFGDKEFNVILNILSPSNYDEFKRVLEDKGMLVKVIPGREYLKELRNIFHGKTARKTYSNHKVIENFSKNFNITVTKSIYEEIIISKENLEHIIRMTPLSWGAAESEIIRAHNIDKVTLDLTIIIGKKE